jgi:Zn-finger nucleic acid-binding protein
MIVECPGCQSRYDVTGRPPGTRARCRCGTVFPLPEAPRSAGALSCPQCAAVVPVGGARCDHCGAELLVKACPRCFGRMFHGARHCNHCGADVSLPASADVDGNATPRLCPRCPDRGRVHLVGRLVDGYLLDQCDSCGGVYVDAAVLERVIADRRAPSAADAAGLAPRPAADAGAAGAYAPQPGPVYVRCPDCDGLMTRRNFGRSSGVLIDVCPPHGTWFDANELPRVIAFVRDGGLERSERRDLERQREEARSERVRAAVVLPGDLPEEPVVGVVALAGLLRSLSRLFG